MRSRSNFPEMKMPRGSTDGPYEARDYRRIGRCRIARDQKRVRAACITARSRGQQGAISPRSVELLRRIIKRSGRPADKRGTARSADSTSQGMRHLRRSASDSRGGLVALLGGLRAKLHDDYRKGAGTALAKTRPAGGLSRDVTDGATRSGQLRWKGKRAVKTPLKGDPPSAYRSLGSRPSGHPGRSVPAPLGERAAITWRGGGVALHAADASDAEPVSHTAALAEAPGIFAGLMSLWMRPRSCNAERARAGSRCAGMHTSTVAGQKSRGSTAGSQAPAL